MGGHIYTGTGVYTAYPVYTPGTRCIHREDTPLHRKKVISRCKRVLTPVLSLFGLFCRCKPHPYTGIDHFMYFLAGVSPFYAGVTRYKHREI